MASVALANRARLWHYEEPIIYVNHRQIGSRR
jgi:hypothetical protein